jgi:hypothetical protein
MTAGRCRGYHHLRWLKMSAVMKGHSLSAEPRPGAEVSNWAGRGPGGVLPARRTPGVRPGRITIRSVPSAPGTPTSPCPCLLRPGSQSAGPRQKKGHRYQRSDMIGYTLPEMRRLLNSRIQSRSPEPGCVWFWSAWRRRRSTKPGYVTTDNMAMRSHKYRCSIKLRSHLPLCRAHESSGLARHERLA